MSESKHKTWLWPDRTIGKRESRVLRDEHNDAINTLEELLAACERVLRSIEWSYSEDCMKSEEQAALLKDAINQAKGKGA